MIARDVKMTNAEVVSYAEVLDKALKAKYLEDRIWKDGTVRREANRNKGFHEGNKKKANKGQSSGTDKKPRTLATNNNNHNSYNHHNNCNNYNNDRNRGNHQNNRVEHPSCPKCSRRHVGECQTSTNKCYRCSQVDHLRKDCPQWKVGQSSNSNLVVLIDFGATHSYVAINMIDKLGIPCKLFEDSVSTMLSSGDMVLSTSWLQSAPIAIEGRECLKDLIELDIPDNDAIIGTDWLSKHGTTIDCRKKIVEFRPEEGEIFSFKGEMVGFCTPIISALEAQNMM
ncbi:uncharacterized protein LOC133795940 [Humulus lupulus]|uniref:uncharacterized protein LOC133795940 n=1 Tax=Humulus lupulus TaxID=3486 RepID=UPI002B4091B3|nr:uncharacterized protein LOC133795940 [Humulus lupulus]